LRIHGGDRKAKLDFSSNINPLAPPESVYRVLRICLESKALEMYPDYRYEELRKAISKFYKCDEENVIPTNGAHEAINLAIIALNPKRIVVVEPSYGEYEDLSRTLGIEYTPLLYRRRDNEFYLELEDFEEFCNDRDTLIVVTNPSNPLGIYIDKQVLLNKLSRCRARVLIDEAYTELCSTCPIEIGFSMHENAVIVRSMTKWLGLPGLRLGFLYTSSRELLNRIDILRQPWNVNSLAECLAIEFFNRFENDVKKFIEISRKFIDEERGRVSQELRALGFKVFRSVTNFILVEIPNGLNIVDMLRREGVAVRSCSSFKGLGPDFIRIAIRKREENDILIKLLREVYRV